MTERNIVKVLAILLSLLLFFSCSKDNEKEEFNPIAEEQDFTVEESEATRLSVKDLIESSNGISLTDFITEAKKLQNIKDATVEDSLVYLTTTAGGSICVDLFGNSLRKHDYEDYAVDTCGTYIQNYIDEIENQYNDSISSSVVYDPIDNDSIDTNYGDEEDVIITRATLHHRKILSKRRMAVWSPWPGFKEYDEKLFSKIAERTNINYTIITNYSPSSFKTFGNYDLVFVGAHGSEDGSVFIPKDCSPYYEKEYAYTENGVDKIDLASMTKDGLGYAFIKHGDSTVEAMILKKNFFDKNLSNLSNTIICTSICYAGRNNSQFLQSAMSKGCPEFYGGDNPVQGVGPISFFMYYLPIFVKGASAKRSFEIGKSNMIKGNYNYLRYGNTNVTYFNPYITGVKDVKDVSAILGVKFQFSLDIPGSVNSETTNQYGIYLENLDQYIPLSNSNVVNHATETLYNSVCAYYANVKIDGLMPSTNYRYRSYVIVGNQVVFSGTVENFKTKEASLCPDNNHPHAIDLGIGMKWACCNVGASSPTAFGGYYAWGELQEKASYESSNYKYVDHEAWGESCGDDFRKYYINIGTNIAGSQYDVASVKWGNGWKMPTSDQIRLLVSKCRYEWRVLNGINGGLFTGPNGNSIFIPAAGNKGGYPYYAGSAGLYWSSIPHYNEDDNTYTGVYILFLDNNSGISSFVDWRYAGLPVRPVK